MWPFEIIATQPNFHVSNKPASLTRWSSLYWSRQFHSEQLATHASRTFASLKRKFVGIRARNTINAGLLDNYVLLFRTSSEQDYHSFLIGYIWWPIEILCSNNYNQTAFGGVILRLLSRGFQRYFGCFWGMLAIVCLRQRCGVLKSNERRNVIVSE